MSTCYWTIQGIGINADHVRPHLNPRKLVELLFRELPRDEKVAKWKAKQDLSGFDIDDYLYGQPFDNLADLLTYCDDTYTLTYGDNGEGTQWLYYPPSMPWHHTENEPRSAAEVHQRIVKAVMQVTDLSEEEIDKLIDDDVYAVGVG